MARPRRIEVKNGWYHVTNRGNNRPIIYLDDLELFGKMAGGMDYSTWPHRSSVLRNDFKGNSVRAQVKAILKQM